ncbi:MAG: sodium:solute symporter [Saprospiraceae bacterium]|nr:MAG: sodium:solute symporter [Saprospiraceae bacterium]GIV31891.1 MAG: sodium:solute symporter [Saprospiraceae bacterium]
MLLTFVALYLLLTLAIGFWAGRQVHDTRDFVVAGRKMPLFVSASAMFATWFGSETLMGAPSVFVEHGVIGIIEDPFGAALCLVLVGALVARPLYRMNILTFNDFYRMRFGRAAEIVSALFMIPSYLGWIAGQMVAMAVVLQVLLGMPMSWGIISCTVVVVIYTYVGGMWAVSITDFVQTVMIIIGITALAWQVTEEVGSPAAVLATQPPEFYRFFPEWDLDHIVHWIAAWITIGLGSIPGQDVFQRVMSAKDEKTAVRSGYLSGLMYLTIGFIPLYIGLCAKVLHPELIDGDNQALLPAMTLKYSGLTVQVLFFGAVLSAILSTTSGAILAPATVLGENLVKPIVGTMSDRQLLFTMRLGVVVIAAGSMLMAMSGSTIFELVAQSSALSLVSLFVPLMSGLYWKRATGLGAIMSMSAGMGAWLLCEFVWPTEWPSLIHGLWVSFVAMLIGSYWPKRPATVLAD